MTTLDPRARVGRPIENAIAELTEALDELDALSPNDRSTIGVLAHAMNNYLSVGDAVLTLLARALGDHPDPDVRKWLDGLRRIDAMMEHAVRRLVFTYPADDFPLTPEYVDLPVLIDRACNHHRSRAERAQLEIVCRTVGDVPTVWADAVGTAVVADNLLSHAIGRATPGSLILVQIVPGPGGVVCSVRDTRRDPDPRDPPRPPERNTPPSGGDYAAGAQPPDLAIQIATAFVERMDGKLWSERASDQVPTIAFRLPYHPAGHASRP
jgi:light-regulated signal transduction histidine kinase (bacteriophytochrome)